MHNKVKRDLDKLIDRVKSTYYVNKIMNASNINKAAWNTIKILTNTTVKQKILH